MDKHAVTYSEDVSGSQLHPLKSCMCPTLPPQAGSQETSTLQLLVDISDDMDAVL